MDTSLTILIWLGITALVVVNLLILLYVLESFVVFLQSVKNHVSVRFSIEQDLEDIYRLPEGPIKDKILRRISKRTRGRLND